MITDICFVNSIPRTYSSSKLSDKVSRIIRSHYNKICGDFYKNFYCCGIRKEKKFSLHGDILFCCNICRKNNSKPHALDDNWKQACVNDLHQNGFNLCNKNTVKKWLDENNLKSPRDAILGCEKERNIGRKICEDSNAQELRVFDELKQKYSNVLYHQIISYKEDGVQRWAIPDFLVIEDDYILIYECKLHDYNQRGDQEEKYSILMQKLFPDRMQDFIYIFGDDKV